MPEFATGDGCGNGIPDLIQQFTTKIQNVGACQARSSWKTTDYNVRNSRVDYIDSATFHTNEQPIAAFACTVRIK